MSKNTINIKTIELTDPVEKAKNGDYSHLEIELDYSLGGINYFSGNSYARGYRLSCTPCNIERHDGYSTKSFSLLSGPEKRSPAFAQIEEAKRKSGPRMQKLANLVDAEKVKKYWLNEENDALITYAHNLSVKASL